MTLWKTFNRYVYRCSSSLLFFVCMFIIYVCMRIQMADYPKRAPIFREIMSGGLNELAHERIEPIKVKMHTRTLDCCTRCAWEVEEDVLTETMEARFHHDMDNIRKTHIFDESVPEWVVEHLAQQYYTDTARVFTYLSYGIDMHAPVRPRYNIARQHFDLSLGQQHFVPFTNGEPHQRLRFLGPLAHVHDEFVQEEISLPIRDIRAPQDPYECIEN